MKKSLPTIPAFSFPILGSTASLEKLYRQKKLTYAIRAIISVTPGCVRIPTLWLSDADIYGLVIDYEKTRTTLTATFTELAQQ